MEEREKKKERMGMHFLTEQLEGSLVRLPRRPLAPETEIFTVKPDLHLTNERKRIKRAQTSASEHKQKRASSNECVGIIKIRFASVYCPSIPDGFVIVERRTTGTKYSIILSIPYKYERIFFYIIESYCTNHETRDSHAMQRSRVMRRTVRKNLATTQITRYTYTTFRRHTFGLVAVSQRHYVVDSPE
ncbi:PREDICTED: uncharacterized protein LOC108554896 [Eufriesea mexicana]|uniref:uncharacterized protein LOC108554896 n=1 Tax=Eufriesea mexicana TaxID=516756 RepID=UPI00083BF66C|nr:PREDICTED: uncharacterized protein LOC108554896 [Eufriesea mexicana]